MIMISFTYGKENDLDEGIEKQIQLEVREICTNKISIAKKIINEKRKMQI